MNYLRFLSFLLVCLLPTWKMAAATRLDSSISASLATIDSDGVNHARNLNSNQIGWFESSESDEAWALLEVSSVQDVVAPAVPFVVAELVLTANPKVSQTFASEVSLEIIAQIGGADKKSASIPLSFSFRKPDNQNAEPRASLLASLISHSVSVQADKALGLELWPASATDIRRPESKTSQLEFGTRESRFYIIGQVRELRPIVGNSHALFDKPKRQALSVQGLGSSMISWPQNQVGSQENRLEFHGSRFSVYPEQPFRLGKIEFYNGTHEVGTGLGGVRFETVLDLGNEDEFRVEWPLTIVTTENSGGQTIGADRVEFDRSFSTNHLARGGFKFQLMVWLAETESHGFTYHDGFGVFENSRSKAELHGVFTLDPIAKREEVISSNSKSARDRFLMTESRWVLSPSLLSDSRNVVEIDVDDYDGDGSNDILIVSEDRIEVLSKKSGKLPPTQLRDESFARAYVGDVDGDGSLDIILLGESVTFMRNKGAGYFAELDGSIPGQTYDYQKIGGNLVLFGIYGDIALADFDSDDDLDIVVYSGKKRTNALYVNSGLGEFTYSHGVDLPEITDISTTGLRVFAVDIDNDGDLDLVSSFFDTITGFGSISLNDGTGRFSARQNIRFREDSISLLPVRGVGLAVGDVDNDGDQDGLFLYSDTYNSGLSNDGQGAFSLGGGVGNFSVRAWIKDLDGDGMIDSFLNHARRPIDIFSTPQLYSTILLGREGRFPRASQRLGTGSVVAIGVDDLEADGKLELLLATKSGVEIWRRGPDRIYSAVDSYPIIIEDTAVREAIVRMLGIDAARVTRIDLLRITSLSVDARDQRSVGLPEGLVNMEQLFVVGNLVFDLKLPTDLDRLRRVTMQRANHGPLNPTANDRLEIGVGLERVETIELLDFGISHLELERELPNLRELRLRGNRLRDISFIARIKNLSDLDLRNNDLTELVVPLWGRKLNRLTVADNEIVSLRVPRGMDIGQLTGFSKRAIEYYDPAPSISFRPADGNYIFRFAAIGEESEFVLQGSDDLLRWSVLEADPEVDGAIVVFAVATEPSVSHQFLRLIRR